MNSDDVDAVDGAADGEYSISCYVSFFSLMIILHFRNLHSSYCAF